MIQLSEKDIQNGKYKTSDKEIRGKHKLDGKKDWNNNFPVCRSWSEWNSRILLSDK